MKKAEVFGMLSACWVGDSVSTWRDPHSLGRAKNIFSSSSSRVVVVIIIIIPGANVRGI